MMQLVHKKQPWLKERTFVNFIEWYENKIGGREILPPEEFWLQKKFE